jgi:hypothetical protein
MTRYERISIILAGIALVLAIASPFISYYWFDPQLQAFRHRARLQVTTKLLNPKTKSAADADSLVDVLSSDCEVTITNIGELPGKDIKIVVEDIGDTGGAKKDANTSLIPFTFNPPTPYDLVTRENQSFITINRALPPRGTLTMNFSGLPTTLAVSTEFGETTLVNSGIRVLSLNNRNWVKLVDLAPKQNSKRKKVIHK